jgi:hypothetical protein
LEPFLSVPAQALHMGDFDGDGRGDLLALGNANGLRQAYPRLLFFDTAGHEQDIVDPRIPISSPMVLTLDPSQGQSRQSQQIVFSSEFGIGAAEVTNDRTVLPIAYPIQVLPQGWSYRVLRLQGTAQSLLNEVVLLFMGDSAQGQATPGVIAEASSVTELAPLPKGVQQLAGPPIAANIVDSASPCDEPLLAYSGDEHVYLFEPCDEHGNLRLPADAPRPVVALAGAHPIGQSPIAAFVDDDEHLDLLIGDATDSAQPYVAFGRGDGTFRADPANPDTRATAWPVEIERGDKCLTNYEIDRSFPLAVGDLNHDGVTDWVTHKGVQLTQGISLDTSAQKVRLTTCTVSTPFVRQWTKASIADFNDDGLLDVVAGSSSEPDLDLLRGTGLSVLNPSAIATGGTLHHLGTGDFDGDGITDIVFDALQATAGSVHDRLSIAFGRDAQPPETPVEIGDFATIDQVQTALYAGNDAMYEIGVIATPSDSPGQQLSVFIGSAGRHPIAPMGLQAPGKSSEEMTEGVPLALAAGNIGGGALPSLLAASIDCKQGTCNHRLWLVPSTAAGRFGIPVPSATLPPDFSALRFDPLELTVQLLVGDVDGDHSNDALALTTNVAGTGIDLWRIALPAPGADWDNTSPVELTASTPGRLTFTSNPQLYDVDRDNKPDLILIVDDTNGTQNLGIVINRGGSLDLSQVQYVDLQGNAALAFATSGDEHPPRILVVTDAGTYAISVEKGEVAPGKLIETLPGGSSIAIGDIAGNGLADVAIGNAAGVRLFLEAPKQR